jgi:hypothetical protein
MTVSASGYSNELRLAIKMFNRKNFEQSDQTIGQYLVDKGWEETEFERWIKRNKSGAIMRVPMMTAFEYELSKPVRKQKIEEIKN